MTVRTSDARSPVYQARHRGACGTPGEREPDVGLYEDPRKSEEPRPRGRPEHGQGDPHGPRHRTCTRARHEHAVEDVSGCSLGRSGRSRLVHGGGADPRRPGSSGACSRSIIVTPRRGTARVFAHHGYAGRVETGKWSVAGPAIGGA